MFTSRAEYRLMLRHDNADLRLATKGEKLGLIDVEQADRVRFDQEKIRDTISRLHDTRIGTRTLHQRLRIPGTTWEDLQAENPEVASWEVEKSLQDRIRIEVRYESYIERQMDEVERTRRQERWQLPEDLQYEKIHGLRSEAREKLINLRPDTIAAARRIAGVSPADLSCLLVALRARTRDENLEPS